jgi:hypothetical protein
MKYETVSTALIIAIFIAGIWLFRTIKGDDQWTLMVCETKMENGMECYDNSYEIPGFRSAKECLLEGTSRFEQQGFECGRNCRIEHGINVCSEVCNKAGCSE